MVYKTLMAMDWYGGGFHESGFPYGYARHARVRNTQVSRCCVFQVEEWIFDTSHRLIISH